MSNVIYSWEFQNKKERGSLWYVIALSIVIGLSVWGFFTKQYTMSFIVLLISGLVYFVENNSEDIVSVNITDLGIKVAGVFYNYSSINSFGIVYKDEHPAFLRLYLNKQKVKFIDLDINNSITDNLIHILSDYIEETPKIELNLLEKIILLLKL